jgi:hypothetical protein
MRYVLFCVPGLLLLAHTAAAQVLLGQPEGFSNQFVISQAADRAESVYAADLDGDGDVDVLCASAADGKIAWYENLGGGAFGPQQVISQLGTNPQKVLADDLDGDGDPDVLWAGVQADQIVWHANLGGGSFGPGQALSLSLSSPWSITTSDLDGDGDRDIVAAFLTQNGRVAFFQNLGSGVFGPQQSLPSSSGVYRYVRAADLNGDGRPDLIASRQSPSQFQIFPNLGNLTFGALIPVPSPGGFEVARSIEAADLDGDGNLDLLTTLNPPNGAHWNRNLGTGLFGPRQTISNQVASTSDALAADFDRDGDLDVVASGVGNFNPIGWFENLGGASFGPYKGIVPLNNPDVNSVSSIFTADVDGDGDLDVLSSSVFDDKIAWYSNETPSAVVFGTGCGTPAMTFTPAGFATLGGALNATIGNAPLVAFVILGISDQTSTIGALPLDLTGLGFPGCTLYASLDLFSFTVAPTATPGSLDWTFGPLPLNPALVGRHLYAQAVGVDPLATPAAISASNAIDWQVAD